MSDFDRSLRERLHKTQVVLMKKEGEYAEDTNRFHNFDIAARINNTTPEKALWGMLTKHLVSVMDLVEYPNNTTVERIDEKIGDAINYLILLEGLLLRRIDENRD